MSSNNELIGDSKDISFSVEPDLPPVADAGEDVYIQLPTDFVLLSGLGSSDDKGIEFYEWVQTSGNEQIGIFPAGPSLDVVGLTEGTYEFTLSVFDELGQRDEDSVRVFVEGKLDDNPLSLSLSLSVFLRLSPCVSLCLSLCVSLSVCLSLSLAFRTNAPSNNYFNPFPSNFCFLFVCRTSLLKTLWEKKKLLLTSNFSFSYSVFYPLGEFLYHFH